MNKELNKEIEIYSVENQVTPVSEQDVLNMIAGQMTTQNVGQQKLVGGTFQSANFKTGVQGWQLLPNGNLEANDGNFRGDITGASGTFSGSIVAGSIDIPDTVTANSFHVDTSGNMWLGATTFAAAPGKISNTGAGTFSSITITGGSISGTPISSIPNNSSTDISLLEWQTNVAYSVTDADTIAWNAHTITLSNGRTFSISSGNTGNMAAKTYIYLDTGTSTTVLQTTTTAATAIGANKILLAVAQNATGEAKFMSLKDNQYNIDAANIVANSITANEIAASTITGTNIATMNISGKNATFDTGTIGGFTMSATQLTATNFSVTSGAANTARVEVGSGANTGGINSANASGDIIFWSGATFANRATAPFRVTAAGALTATSVTISGYVVQTKGSFGGDGSDGALSISSGTTTINAAGAALVIKNYTSVSITGTGKLTISNPHANGTILVIKSQGGVTITSSTSPAIDVKGMGADGGAGQTSANSDGTTGSGGNSNVILMTNAGTFGSFSPFTTGHKTGGLALGSFISGMTGLVPMFCGAGGGGAGEGAGGTIASSGGGGASATSSGSNGANSTGGGDGDGGAGGRGGGALYIECAGAYNVSSTLSAAGNNGTAGGATNGSGGGGGGGGCILVLYNTLTSDTGTYTVSGGTGGAAAGTGAVGGAGGTGYSFRGSNNIFS